jgi:hypothetical protein
VKFENYQAHKKTILPYLLDDNNYLTKGKNHGLLITDANLHKVELFSEITAFIRRNVALAMIDLGYKPECVITSMWATKQELGGYHHFHKHANTFLACAMCIHDSDGGAGGTQFVSPSVSSIQMEPAYSGVNYPYFAPIYSSDFEEGSANIFPGWLPHYTNPNTSKVRIVIAANIMPAGVTNHDHFDRYNYPVDLGQLKEYEL